ncbi:hypothetical protein D9M68_425770 [compost metagenome]
MRLHGPQRGGANLHQQGRARNGRAREDPGGPQAVEGADHQHLPFAGREDAARGSAQRRPEAHVFHPGCRRCHGDHPGTAGHHGQGAAAPRAGHHLAVEERADGTGRRRARGHHAGRRGGGQRVPQLRRHAGGLPGGGFRRPDPHSGAAASRQRRGAHPLAEPRALPAGGRIPGHQRMPIPAGPAADGIARDVHGGGRRRSGHLRLAWRDHRKPGEADDRLSQHQAHQTGAELPFGPAHPGGRQPGDREEP